MDNVVIGLVIPNVLERETQISPLGQTIQCSQIEQFGVFPPCSSLHEHSFLTKSVSDLRYFPVDAHITVSLVVTGIVPPAFSTESREIGRSVMERTECGESKSDLGLGIIDTSCLFCVAGSDWWANYKNLLEDIGLKHETDETR